MTPDQRIGVQRPSRRRLLLILAGVVLVGVSLKVAASPGRASPFSSQCESPMDLSWEVAWSAPADSFLEPVAILPDAGGRVRLLLTSGSLLEWRQPQRPRFLSMALVELQETPEGWRRLPPWPDRNRHPDFVAPTALVESDGASHFLWSSAPVEPAEARTQPSDSSAHSGSGLLELELWYALFRDGSWHSPRQILPAVEGWALPIGYRRPPPIRLDDRHLLTLTILAGGRVKGIRIPTNPAADEPISILPKGEGLVGWGVYALLLRNSTGDLHAAIIGGNPSGSVRLTQSRDEGHTWSTPVTIHSPPPPGRATYNPIGTLDRGGNWHLFRHENAGSGTTLIWMRETRESWIQDTLTSLDDVFSSSLTSPECGGSDLFVVNNGVPGTERLPGTRYHGILHHLRIEDSVLTPPRLIPIEGVSVHRAPVGGILPGGEYALMMTGRRIADDANLVLVARTRGRRR